MKKPKTGPASLFDTTEIENLKSNEEQVEVTDNGKDDRNDDTNNKDTADLNCEIEEDASHYRSRSKRSHRKSR